jgi:hypothetical protein
MLPQPAKGIVSGGRFFWPSTLTGQRLTWLIRFPAKRHESGQIAERKDALFRTRRSGYPKSNLQKPLTLILIHPESEFQPSLDEFCLTGSLGARKPQKLKL